MKSLFFFFVCLFLASSPHAFELQVPLRCQIGKECFVQNYVDQAKGADYQDYRCEHHTYDKHDGTDIRLPTLAEMNKGVDVIAAADGTVLGVRDEVEDISVRKIDRATIKNRECGNGVVIQHADGYQTQYCHMKKGSVRVAKGQQVKTGDVLGQIGLSGDTEFPHLHLSVRKDGKKIDPFNNTLMESGCNQQPSTLWSAYAAKAFQYHPTNILKTGFSSTVPTLDGVLEGKIDGTTLPPNAPVLIYWVFLMGLEANDELQLSLKNPTGETLVETTKAVDHSKAQYFSFIGKKLKTENWPTGEYVGNIAVIRDGKTITEQKSMFKVE